MEIYFNKFYFNMSSFFSFSITIIPNTFVQRYYTYDSFKHSDWWRHKLDHAQNI